MQSRKNVLGREHVYETANRKSHMEALPSGLKGLGGQCGARGSPQRYQALKIKADDF